MKTDNYTMVGIDNKQAVLNMHVASTIHIFYVYHIHNGISSVIIFCTDSYKEITCTKD